MHARAKSGQGWFARAYFAEFSFAFIGIGILRFWYQYNLYNLHSTTDYGAGVAWTNILRAVVIGILLLCAFRRELPVRTRNALVWGSLALMSASSIFNFWELVTDDFSLEVARYVTCGVGLVWGGGMWMDFFARLRPARAFLYLVAGLAFSCVLSLLCGYMPTYTMGLVNLFVPACAVLSYWSAMHRLDVRERCAGGTVNSLPAVGNGLRYDGSTRTGLLHVICSYFIFALVLGIALGFPDGVPRELSQGARSVHQMFIVAVLGLVAAWVLVRGGRLRFPAVWYFENGLLALAVVLLIGDTPGSHTVATALMLTAESFFYSFTFFTSYDMGRHMRRTPMFMLGVMYGGTLLCMGVGRLLSFYVAELPGGGLAMAAIMSVLVVAEMLLALRPTMFGHDLSFFAELSQDARAMGCKTHMAPGGPGATEGDAVQRQEVSVGDVRVQEVPSATPDASVVAPCGPEDDLTVRLAVMRGRFGLTDVEVHIADLLAHGRTRAVIAVELGYSENTIRNYTRMLYQKLNVHTKQELIDLLDGSGERV